MNTEKSRLSMEEFLTMNQNYAEHRKIFEKKNTRNAILGVLSGFAVVPISIYIGIIIGNVLIALGVIAVLVTILIVYITKSESKARRELEEQGSRLYQEYLKENDFI